MRGIVCLAIGMTLLGVIGCGGSNRPLSGRVTFEDGSPLSEGTVCLLKDGYLARGAISPDGTFRVGSTDDSDGLEPGTYQVYIDGASVEDPKASSGMRSLIDEKLSNPETSELTHRVPEDGDTLNIIVKAQ